MLISACPGPPICNAVHTYLFVDGLDFIARSNSGAGGGHPSQLLRPGGPLYPTEQGRTVQVTEQDEASSGSSGVEVRVKLRGQTVIWSDLMYPGADDRVVEEVRFNLSQYLAEIERGYWRWGSACLGVVDRSSRGRHIGVGHQSPT
ncbi:hypothetical protein [Nocardia albiluteola]|uniref:hypothetical protein n=1 Tax=Nocardia albiluteola TaxID=2842303 RepID=UPI001FD9DCA1|nr:hypothetical protein [Nocardia albiluteola]